MDAATEKELSPFCIGCGYSLRDIAAPRCPECGRAFDPNDLKRTTRATQHGNRITDMLMRPPGRPMNGAAVAAFLLLMIGDMVPGSFGGALILGGMLGLFLIVCWFARLVLLVAVGLYFDRKARRGLPVLIAWGFGPFLAVLSLCMMRLGIPMRVTFRANQIFMTSFARSILSTTGPRPTSGWAGFLPANQIESDGTTVSFEVTGSGELFKRGGFLYAPNSPRPMNTRYRRYHYHGGGWYSWVDDFD